MLRLAVGLAFIVVPVLELALLIKTGQIIGVWATVALVLTTALTGAIIISRQSLSVLRRTLEALSEGRPPVAPVVDGLFLLAAGALLLTPGLLTDAVALALLVPPVRRAIARACMGWMLHRAQVSIRVDDERWEPDTRRRSAASRDGPVIDGEFERLDERPSEPRQGSRGPPQP
jgi:UPF0716 protein FxsA